MDKFTEVSEVMNKTELNKLLSKSLLPKFVLIKVAQPTEDKRYTPFSFQWSSR